MAPQTSPPSNACGTTTPTPSKPTSRHNPLPTNPHARKTRTHRCDIRRSRTEPRLELAIEIRLATNPHTQHHRLDLRPRPHIPHRVIQPHTRQIPVHRLPSLPTKHQRQIPPTTTHHTSKKSQTDRLVVMRIHIPTRRFNMP